ncbi:30S ribosomal protein S12 methylthiotransferase RimO [Desulfococcaceae bacterium HSG8]|nr:30S ribosomal protein S12 methylthiotransferase RimO [Desulfococcaceae bacterium HSG8]
MKTKKLHLVSLGCAKNLVDSEIMLGKLMEGGWTLTREPAEAHVIVINTCSFIESAIDESVDTILELAKYKEHGNCRSLIVAGCLPERFGQEIVPELPEVDVFLGTGAFDRIAEAVNDSISEVPGYFFPDPELAEFGDWKFRMKDSSLRTPNSAFIKIAEGCSRHCTYCIIPRLRGTQRSRSPEDILSEAGVLFESGAKELILVAQDTTSYGKDINDGTDLACLLERLSDISPDNIWLRFMYGHPLSMNDKLIRTVAEMPNICTYFDIPIQHASSSVLKLMARNYSRDDLMRMFDKIRSMSPDASLRTTVITGFPGETDKDFKTLLQFVEAVRFDHLGTFIYSDSEDLPSHRLPNHVPEDVAKERYDLIMSRQSEISSENNRRYMGRVLDVLVEEDEGEDVFTGRASFQAPEVDGITYIRSGDAVPGNFVPVKIKDTLEYDLIGDLVV